MKQQYLLLTTIALLSCIFSISCKKEQSTPVRLTEIPHLKLTSSSTTSAKLEWSRAKTTNFSHYEIVYSENLEGFEYGYSSHYLTIEDYNNLEATLSDVCLCNDLYFQVILVENSIDGFLIKKPSNIVHWQRSFEKLNKNYSQIAFDAEAKNLILQNNSKVFIYSLITNEIQLVYDISDFFDYRDIDHYNVKKLKSSENYLCISRNGTGSLLLLNSGNFSYYKSLDRLPYFRSNSQLALSAEGDIVYTANYDVYLMDDNFETCEKIIDYYKEVNKYLCLSDDNKNLYVMIPDNSTAEIIEYAMDWNNGKCEYKRVKYFDTKSIEADYIEKLPTEDLVLIRDNGLSIANMDAGIKINLTNDFFKYCYSSSYLFFKKGGKVIGIYDLKNQKQIKTLSTIIEINDMFYFDDYLIVVEENNSGEKIIERFKLSEVL